MTMHSFGRGALRSMALLFCLVLAGAAAAADSAVYVIASALGERLPPNAKVGTALLDA